MPFSDAVTGVGREGGGRGKEGARRQPHPLTVESTPPQP